MLRFVGPMVGPMFATMFATMFGLMFATICVKMSAQVFVAEVCNKRFLYMVVVTRCSDFIVAFAMVLVDWHALELHGRVSSAMVRHQMSDRL